MNVESITASKITTYLQCQRKYAFRYVERVPPAFKPAALAFGSAIHSALEYFHRQRMESQTASADEIVGLFLADFASEQVETLRFKQGDDPAKLAALGDALIRAYVAAHPDLQVRAVEWAFQVPLADPATGEVLGPGLRGTFDLLLPDDVLVELKTAARAYDEGTLARNLQLTAYAYAYRQLYGCDPTIRVVALLKHKKPKVESYGVTRTQEDAAWFVRLAAEVARGIEAGVFPPNPGWMCPDCEYQIACAAWRGPNPTAGATDGRRHLPIIEKEATV